MIFEKKVESLKNQFRALTTPEQKYLFLIEMGRNLPPYPPEQILEEAIVRGCQSKLYLHSTLCDGKIFFTAQADALISAGLAALLIRVYSEENPELVLKYPPSFLQELGIHTSLSLSRSNGLAHIHLKMRQEALKYLLLTNSR